MPVLPISPEHFTDEVAATFWGRPFISVFRQTVLIAKMCFLPLGYTLCRFYPLIIVVVLRKLKQIHLHYHRYICGVIVCIIKCKVLCNTPPHISDDCKQNNSVLSTMEWAMELASSFLAEFQLIKYYKNLKISRVQHSIENSISISFS